MLKGNKAQNNCRVNDPAVILSCFELWMLEFGKDLYLVAHSPDGFNG